MKKTITFVAFLFYLKANAQLGDTTVKAKLQLAQQYLTGYNHPYNPAKAFAIFKQSAMAGNSIAMNALGVQYRLGLGTDTNYTAALGWFQQSANKNYPSAWYNLGLLYKYGFGTTIDYTKAYDCFTKAAVLGNVSGIYAEGYMEYKGLGCTQNYTQAVSLFRQGVSKGKANCMYFLGLCMRNGYGTDVNKDSAAFWLKKAASLGYSFATDELAIKEPENTAAIGKLLTRAEEAKKIAAAINRPINQYSTIPHSLPVNEINGQYQGYLLKYDYSGKNIVQASSLSVRLNCEGNNVITGQWTESDSLILPIKAFLNSNGIAFSNMQYSKTDHYSLTKAVAYNFDKASLQISRLGDSVILTGNILQYSPDTKEPEKPLQAILLKIGSINGNGTIEFTDKNGETLQSQERLTVYPNPFSSNGFNVQLTLPQGCKVYTQLLTLDGRVVYTQPAAMLAKGGYVLPLQPKVAAGTYLVRLVYGAKTKTATIIKQ